MKMRIRLVQRCTAICTIAELLFSTVSNKLQCTIAVRIRPEILYSLDAYVSIRVGILRHLLLEFVYLLLDDVYNATCVLALFNS